MHGRLLLATIGTCAAALTACGTDDPPADRLRAPEASSAGSDVGSTSGALFGSETTSCVEPYSPAAARGHAFAFDGDVVSVGPSVTNRSDGADLDVVGVTFAVREWFAGGGDDTFTVDMPPPGHCPEASSESGPEYTTGTRLLVSGEPRWGGPPQNSPIAWTCGFTRYYDPQTAAQWRSPARS